MLSGKGLVPAAKPTDDGMEARLAGRVSRACRRPTARRSPTTRARSTALTPYTDAIRLTPPNVPIGSPIPRTVGGSSPIKHVFYIIRENRTYDSDSRRPEAGQRRSDAHAVRPRRHAQRARARRRTSSLFDNFYVDADVSYDGHAFSTAAYATDFIAEDVADLLRRTAAALYLGEGGGFMRNPFGNICGAAAAATSGTTRSARNVSVRSYGEFVQNTSEVAPPATSSRPNRCPG